MSARKASKVKTRVIRPGQGNPHWGRSYVTASRFQNWKPDKRDRRRTPRLTLSAGPGLVAKRVKVSLGESVFTEKTMSGGPNRGMLDLKIQAWVPMRGQIQVFDEPVTIAQALSFEEAVRAVFRAAREEGILPPVHFNEV